MPKIIIKVKKSIIVIKKDKPIYFVSKNKIWYNIFKYANNLLLVKISLLINNIEIKNNKYNPIKLFINNNIKKNNNNLSIYII